MDLRALILETHKLVEVVVGLVLESGEIFLGRNKDVESFDWGHVPVVFKV